MCYGQLEIKRILYLRSPVVSVNFRQPINFKVRKSFDYNNITKFVF